VSKFVPKILWMKYAIRRQLSSS